MAYNMLAFNNPQLWGVGQNNDFGQALYQNWQRQLNEVMGFEDQIQKWNAQRDKDQLSQMVDQSALASQLSTNNANILNVSDSMIARAKAANKKRAEDAAANTSQAPGYEVVPRGTRLQNLSYSPVPTEQSRAMELLGLMDETTGTDPYWGPY